MTRPIRIMLVAVEASADALGAGLARELKARLGDGVELFGVGGQGMAAAGVASPIDIGRLSLAGLFEIAGAVPHALQMIEMTVRAAEAKKPDVAVLIDSWEFTWRVARRLRLRSPQTRLVKFVAPQVWATRPGRARSAARLFDRMLTLFPFETRYFEEAGLTTICVGAPPLTGGRRDVDLVRIRGLMGAGPDDSILLLAPGSRPGEIRRVMPAFADAAQRLKSKRPEVRLALLVAPTVAEAVRALVRSWPFPPVLLENDTDRTEAMRAATLALACSGTVTTELAAAGCPMIVAYRAHPATAAIARLIIRTKHLALINIAAGRQVAPEFLQSDCTGASLAAAADRLLGDPQARRRQVEAQTCALRRLDVGGADPFALAADAILDLAAEQNLA